MNIGFFFTTIREFDAHMLPFIVDAPSREYKFYMFHLNKICAPNSNKEDTHCTSIDLSNIFNIKETLRLYNLDFMIFNGPGQIFSIFLIDICKQLKIKTVYFQHGLSLDLSTFNFKSLEQGQSLRRRFDSIKKYLSFFSVIGRNIFFLEKKIIILQHIITKILHLLAYLFMKKIIYKFPKYGLKSSHCDYAFVYGNKDKNYLVESLKMAPQRITVSGYPFLSPTIKKLSNNKKHILYLTSAFRVTGILPISIEDEREFYFKLYSEVNSLGYKLDIKVHPTDNYELIKSYFEGLTNVNILKNENLADLTLASSIVISDFSTALFYAIKYYKHIIILTSEYFKSYPFDYTKYGIGVKTDVENLSNTIRKLIDSKPKNNSLYLKFLNDFLGNNSNQNSYSIFYSTLSKIVK